MAIPWDILKFFFTVFLPYFVRPRQRSPPQTKKDREAELHYITWHDQNPKLQDFVTLWQGHYLTDSIVLLHAKRSQCVLYDAVWSVEKIILVPDLCQIENCHFELKNYSSFFFFQRFTIFHFWSLSNRPRFMKFCTQLLYTIL